MNFVAKPGSKYTQFKTTCFCAARMQYNTGILPKSYRFYFVLKILQISASRGRTALITLLCCSLFTASAGGQSELKLPNLGESSTSLFSTEYEHQLGRAWLRMFRSQVPTIDDPLLFDYLENLIYELATHSKLQDRRIELVLVDNANINAFAVPGGVIGIHNGLLLYAQTEDELATVLSHEIAHLSQRHFSRGVEFRKNQQPLNLAALLAGLVLMATAGGDAGMAALTDRKSVV